MKLFFLALLQVVLATDAAFYANILTIEHLMQTGLPLFGYFGVKEGGYQKVPVRKKLGNGLLQIHLDAVNVTYMKFGGDKFFGFNDVKPKIQYQSADKDFLSLEKGLVGNSFQYFMPEAWRHNLEIE